MLGSYRLWSSTLRKAPLRLHTRPVGWAEACGRFFWASIHFKTCSTGFTWIPHLSALVRTSVLLAGCFCCFTDCWSIAWARVCWRQKALREYRFWKNSTRICWTNCLISNREGLGKSLQIIGLATIDSHSHKAQTKLYKIPQVWCK